MLCTLQAFAHNHQFPRGFLLRWFSYMLDNEVVPMATFNEWKADSGVSKSEPYPGKGAAISNLSSFFEDLENGD